jgi:hypothetical protein
MANVETQPKQGATQSYEGANIVKVESVEKMESGDPKAELITEVTNDERDLQRILAAAFHGNLN